MKNSLIALAVVSSAFMPFVASAHDVYDNSNTVVVSTISDDVYAANIAAAQSRNSLHLMHMAPGQSYTSSLGVSDTCPWFYAMGCVWTVAL